MILSYHNLSGEAYQAGTNTEACALAGHNTHARAEDIQNSEHCSGGNGHSQNLVHGESLLGDEDQSESNSYTFNDVLDYAG